MVNDDFSPVENHPIVYGTSAVQPSVGDSGAPVFTFTGNHLFKKLYSNKQDNHEKYFLDKIESKYVSDTVLMTKQA